MDDAKLVSLQFDTVVIVPTRSLANVFTERVARHQLALNKTVWTTPNVMVWSDYVRRLWQLNRDNIAKAYGVYSLISPSQASLLWSQVIESSKREESELTLLNVQQTTQAVQRSWKLMHDWQIDAKQLKQDHVADIEQFVAWLDAYQNVLAKRGMIDEHEFLKRLLIGDFKVKHPYNHLILASYDLITAAQQSYFEIAQNQGLKVSFDESKRDSHSEKYLSFNDTTSEIKAALEHARRCVENDPKHRVSIVIPDLQTRFNQVSELARSVFYPSGLPLDVEHNDKVYQLGLGQALTDVAAIEASLTVLNVLKNKINTIDLGFLFRNRYLTLGYHHVQATRLFQQWLKRQRYHTLTFDQLPNLFEQFSESLIKTGITIDQVDDESFAQALERLVAHRQSVQALISSAKENHDFAALSFKQWVNVFDDWLHAWGWRTAVNNAQMNSPQYQLKNRWMGLLEEFANLGAVQSRVGLNKALELLTQMARNTVFFPKCAASPVVISGLLEAIGNEVDTCIITGMTQDFPSPPVSDSFIANRFLIKANHPQARSDTGFEYAQKVMKNLMSCANNVCVSFAISSDLNREITLQASPLFRNKDFEHDSNSTDAVAHEELEYYQDTQGPGWQGPDRPKGGSKIFENQSNCAFKAFVTHQIGFVDEREAEFGLDGLDHGVVAHYLLEKIWQELHTQRQLLSLSESEKTALFQRHFEQMVNANPLKLSYEKLTLLRHEQSRLQALIKASLAIDAARPQGFSAVELEEQRIGEMHGIEYKYVIDRLDISDDGRSVIIDYKTGTVNSKDWQGERIKSPQMPLYALALDEFKHQAVSGIAYAQIKQNNSKYSELSETNIFRKENKITLKLADSWQQSRAQWPSIFEQLAKDFLAGNAVVNPVDKNTCKYCQLKAVCRVSQLRQSPVANALEELS